MIQEIVVAVSVGLVSGGFSAYVGHKVLEVRVKRLEDEQMIHREEHKELLPRLVFRDTCQVIHESSRERYDQLIERVTSMDETLKRCFADLLAELRK